MTDGRRRARMKDGRRTVKRRENLAKRALDDGFVGVGVDGRKRPRKMD